MKIHLVKKLHAPKGHLHLELKAELKAGTLVTLYGESGAGKTSVLRMLAGLMEPEQGTIEVDGEIWYDTQQKINVNARHRKVGFVFQDYALFPNMTVRQNLEYALDKDQPNAIVDELLEMMSLDDLSKRKPETLSGGQKQRVALARALVRKPKLLMLDEPLSALDKSMRLKLQDYILQMHRNFGLTTILVSHEAGEIFRMSDEILVLQEGRIVQRSTPANFFTQKEISGKFKFTGEVIKIEREDVVFVISVLIGNNLVKVIADENEVGQYAVGDTVLVASKAFNPLIQKMH